MNNEITFIQLPVDLRLLYQLAARRDWGAKGSIDEGRALHHALGEVFGPKALQPFRLMVAARARDASVYAYSSLAEDELRQLMQISPPDTQEPFNCSTLRCKTLPTHFPAGRRLGFDIRIRPICRVRRDKSVKPREMDFYQRQAELHGDEEGWHKVNNRETVYHQWLTDRFAKAARIECGAKLARFQRVRTARKNVSSEGPDAIIQGTLEVTDKEEFARLLQNGIGRHKAYGYGMILLRPAGQPPLRR